MGSLNTSKVLKLDSFRGAECLGTFFSAKGADGLLTYPQGSEIGLL